MIICYMSFLFNIVSRTALSSTNRRCVAIAMIVGCVPSQHPSPDDAIIIKESTSIDIVRGTDIFVLLLG